MLGYGHQDYAKHHLLGDFKWKLREKKIKAEQWEKLLQE